MEDKLEEKTNAEESYHPQKSLKETFRTGSPDDVRDKVRDAVEKGVAAVAGALKGFADRVEKQDVAGTTKQALHEAGESARSAVSGLSEEAKNLREPLRQAGQRFKETARHLKSDVSSQIAETKDALTGPPSGMAKGIGGSVDEKTTPGVPDLRRARLGETNEELRQRELDDVFE